MIDQRGPHRERELSERAWDFFEWVEDDTRRKAELAVGRAHLSIALKCFECISMTRCVEMETTLIPALKNVDVSRIRDAHAFVDRVAAKVAAGEASPVYEVMKSL